MRDTRDPVIQLCKDRNTLFSVPKPTTLQSGNYDFASRTAGLRTAGAARAILDYISHKLRLQFVGAAFAANGEGAFFHRQFFVPWGEMHYGSVVVAEGGPHDPPALAATFHNAAVRASATDKRAGDQKKIFGHGVNPRTRNCNRGTGAGHYPFVPPFV